MDPVSIISTIGAVGAVANGTCALAVQLYTFIEGTRNVSQAVTALVDEINGLNSVLDAVKLGLQSDVVKLAEKRASSDDSRLLWESIQGSLNDCQATIDRLERAIENVVPEGKNFAKQAVRRIKLNLMDSEITTFRSQIKAHTNTLQMALQMVNLRAAYLAPGQVTDELGSKIDELQAIMELVHGSEADLKRKSLGIEPEYLIGLRKSAQRVISGATTVGVRSETAGSLWGDVMDEDKRNETLTWLSESKPVIYEEPDGPRPPPSLSDAYSGSQTLIESMSNAEEGESDSDGDFDFEVVETFFTRGSKKFDDGLFAEAKLSLQEGLELAEKLPLNRQQPALIADIKLKIATCLCHSPNLKEAEARLNAIINEKIHENITDEGAIRRCQASHLLAGVLFRQGRYSPAMVYGKRALIGFRRVLGKDHMSYYESLSLLSQISEASGQKEYAETYLAMIPSDVVPTLVKIKDEFPDMQQRPPSLCNGEISPTTIVSGDNFRDSLSPSETQFSTRAGRTNQFPRTSAGSLSVSVASSESSSQITPSRGSSTSSKLPASTPHRPTLTPLSTVGSTPTSPPPVAITPTDPAAVGQQKKSGSFFKKFRRSTANPAPTQVPVSQEEKADTGRLFLPETRKSVKETKTELSWPGLA